MDSTTEESEEFPSTSHLHVSNLSDPFMSLRGTYNDGQLSYRSVAFGTWKVGDSSRRFYRGRDAKAPANGGLIEELKGSVTSSSSAAPGVAGGQTLTKRLTITTTKELGVANSSLRVKRTPSNRSMSLQDLTAFRPTHVSSELETVLYSTTNDDMGSQTSHSYLQYHSPPGANVCGEMGGKRGDCYSSAEYMQYCDGHLTDNPNVLSAPITSSLATRHLFCPEEDDFSMRSCPPSGASCHRPPTCSHLVKPLPTNYLLPSAAPPYPRGRPPCCITESTFPTTPFFCTLVKVPKHTSTFSKAKFPVSPNREFVIDTTMRCRTRSLDSSAKFAVKHADRGVSSTPCPCPVHSKNGDTVVNGRTSAENSDEQNGADSAPAKFGAIQSAKDICAILRRLYSSSTTLRKMRKGSSSCGRLRRKGSISGSCNDRNFQSATSPFFEIRLPDPEERPFLPYNIRYQVEDAKSVAGSGDRSKLVSPFRPATLPYLNGHSSPDEGISSVSNSSDSSFVASTRNASPLATAGTGAASMDRSQGRELKRNNEAGPSGARLVKTAPMVGEDYDEFTNGLRTSIPCYSTDHLLHPMMGIASTGDVDSFSNWDELFKYLKKEITEIRERDSQIFRNLKNLEEEIGSVK